MGRGRGRGGGLRLREEGRGHVHGVGGRCRGGRLMGLGERVNVEAGRWGYWLGRGVAGGGGGGRGRWAQADGDERVAEVLLEVEGGQGRGGWGGVVHGGRRKAQS